MQVLCVEGPIGSGKSTLLRNLSRKYNVHYEPVDQMNHARLLKRDAFDNCARAGMDSFMSYLSANHNIQWKRESRNCQDDAISRQRQVLDKFISRENEYSAGEVNVVERSLWSCKNVFAPVAVEMGLIEPDCEFSVLEQHPPDLYIFLECSPDECVKRSSYKNENFDENYVRRICQMYNDVPKPDRRIIFNSEKFDEKLLAEAVDKCIQGCWRSRVDDNVEKCIQSCSFTI